MSSRTLHQSILRREQDLAVDLRRQIAGLASQISRKQIDLGRAKTPSEANRIARQIGQLQSQRDSAERKLASHERRVARYSEKVVKDERDEQNEGDNQRKQRERDEERSRRAMERRLHSTTTEIGMLHNRVSGLESALIARVREEIAAEPGEREHDVFLSYADPDESLAREIYVELAGRGLSVWFAPVSRRLGESQTRQFDKGIASSKVSVPLLTKAYLEGRYWTEKEYGAFFSTRKRIIPVLHGVDHAALGRYSPMLADLWGLSTKKLSIDEIAYDIAEALAPDSDQPAL